MATIMNETIDAKGKKRKLEESLPNNTAKTQATKHQNGEASIRLPRSNCDSKRAQELRQSVERKNKEAIAVGKPIVQSRIRTQKEVPTIEDILQRNAKPTTTSEPPDLFVVGHQLDFDARPRMKRDGSGHVELQQKNGLKITADMKYMMMLYAIEMGYSLTEPNYANKYGTTNKNLPVKKCKKTIHEAACNIVCYDYGLLKPLGSTTLHVAFESFRKNKYSHTKNLFEPRHKERGRKSYIDKIEEQEPNYLKTLFLYAKEKADEYTTHNDYRKMMIERSKQIKPELDLDLTMNDMSNFFEKNPKLKPRGVPKRRKHGNNFDSNESDLDTTELMPIFGGNNNRQLNLANVVDVNEPLNHHPSRRNHQNLAHPRAYDWRRFCKPGALTDFDNSLTNPPRMPREMSVANNDTGDHFNMMNSRFTQFEGNRNLMPVHFTSPLYNQRNAHGTQIDKASILNNLEGTIFGDGNSIDNRGVQIQDIPEQNRNKKSR